MEEDLSVDTIIIVACVCGSVVLILTIVLIVLCCRRYRTKQKYQKAEAGRPPPIMTHSNGGNHQEEPLKSALRNHSNGGSGVENPGLDHNDAIDFDDPSRSGVFATETSHQLPPGYYHDRSNHSNHGNHGNGYVPNGGAPWKNGIPPPSYDNSLNDELNRRNRDPYSSAGKANKNITPRDKQYLQLDDPYHPHNTSKDSHHHHPLKDSDSGVSTPDPQKPKKVIYEVIV